MALMRTEICESCELRIEDLLSDNDQTCDCATYDVLTCFILYGERELIDQGKIDPDNSITLWFEELKN